MNEIKFNTLWEYLEFCKCYQYPEMIADGAFFSLIEDDEHQSIKKV
jgi:hypothetical protein